MPQFGPTSRTELIRGLRKFGFHGPYSGGKHQFMVKKNLRLRIPNSHGEDVGRSLLRMILREAEISIQEWEET